MPTTILNSTKASPMSTMRALTLNSSSQTPLFQKPIFYTQLPTKPTFSFSSTHQNKSNFKLSAASSSSSSVPFSPSTQGDEEKFDWYSHWYPVAAVCDLNKKFPHARRVLGLDIVVWWDRNEEKWQVFDDSCPHRLAPLSEGRIDQWGRLQCVYHGWCFNGGGDCKFIPQAARDGPEVHKSRKACATVYPSMVQNKIVWFWPKSEPRYIDIATKEKPPYVPELDDPSYVSLIMSREHSYGYEILTENLMDPAHLIYAHYGLFPPPEGKPRGKLDREGGTPIEMSVKQLHERGFLVESDDSFIEFVAPCLLRYADDHLVSDKSPSTEGKRTTANRYTLVFFCVPISPGRSRVIYTVPRNFAIWVDRVLPRWIFHIHSNLVLDSDMYLLHLEETKLLDAGVCNWQQACFLPTKSDTCVVTFRNWLNKHSGGRVKLPSKFDTNHLPSPSKEQVMDRYWSHVVNCSSCSRAVKYLKVCEVGLQLISIGLIGMVAVRQGLMSAATKCYVVSFAVLCFVASKWLSVFIHKTFYFHGYNHGLK